jgi:geranylgeranyl pyrophosphate synthase
MGKMTGTDEEKSKATYPRLLGVEASRIRARDLLAAGRKD